MKTRAFILSLLFALGFTISSAQNSISISGTVYAALGSNVQNTVVIACLIVGGGCDSAGTKYAQIGSSGSSASYQITGLSAQNYLVLAWHDLNNNQDPDAGDELVVYQKNGKASVVTAPAENIDLRLAKFTGDFDALISQAEQPSTPVQPNTPVQQTTTALTFSGTVRALPGSSLQNTVVLAAVFDNGKYDQGKSKIATLTSAGGFKISELEARAYVLFAWRDLDGNKDISLADEIAPYRFVGQLVLATPPINNMVLQMEKGDSSFDTLIALTVNQPTSSNTNNPTSSNTNTPTSSATQGTMTEIDCGRKQVFYGDYGCIIPPAESYLGNSRCPTTATFPGLRQEKGFFTGYLYDSCNRPIVGAKIILSQSNGGTKGTTLTDSKGFYRLESQYVVGAYVYANMRLKDNGNDYSMTIFPEDRIYGLDGGIQNTHHDMRDSSLWFWKDFYGFDVPQNPKLEFTLEPVKYFDGTTPKGKQVFNYQAEDTRIKFAGVKYGVYKVSVQLLTPNGRIRTWLKPERSDKTFEQATITIIGTNVVDLTIQLKP